VLAEVRRHWCGKAASGGSGLMVVLLRFAAVLGGAEGPWLLFGCGLALVVRCSRWWKVYL
jgi:hypothetical protein